MINQTINNFRAFNGFFVNIFKHKNVCVVSGRQIEEELGSEIDSYDIVVRLNEFDLGYPFEETRKKYGKKTDVVFRECNDIVSRRLCGNRNREYIDSLIRCGVKYLIFFDGNGNPSNLVRELREVAGSSIKIDFIDWDLFKFITENIQGNKFASTGLLCLTAIAFSRPKKIKTIGFSFDDEYGYDNVYLKISDLRPSSAFHNLKSELKFFKDYLLPLKVFELDEKLSKSLEQIK